MCFNVCFIKFRSKHSTVLLLCLLRNLMKQTLLVSKVDTLEYLINAQGCHSTVKYRDNKRTGQDFSWK